MAGFFRRLRRAKPTDETTDGEEAPAEETSEEPTEGNSDDTGGMASEEPLPEANDAPPSDIYPPEGFSLPVPEAAEAAEAVVPPTPEPPAEAPLPSESLTPPETVAPPEAPAPPAPGSPESSVPSPGPIPEAPLPEGAPPPLPEADPTAAMTSLSRQRPGTRCFLCGSEMDGSYCPSCKMHWTE